VTAAGREARVAALLLTGGASRRMGADKAAITVDGEQLATRLARLLQAVATPVLEVGPGRTSCAVVVEPMPGSGPLSAIAAGHAALVECGREVPTIVCACDLPFVTVELLALIAGRPGERSVLPVVDGRSQPLLARWSVADMRAAAPLVATGVRSLRSLPSRADAELLDRRLWLGVATPETFADLDSPGDLARLGLPPLGHARCGGAGDARSRPTARRLRPDSER